MRILQRSLQGAIGVVLTISLIFPASAESTRSTVEFASKTQVFAGPKHTLNACWKGESGQSCKTVRMPNAVGKVLSLKAIAPVEGSVVSWLVFTRTTGSVCGLKLDSVKVVCSKMTQVPGVLSKDELAQSRNTRNSYVISNMDKMLTSYATARVNVKMGINPDARRGAGVTTFASCDLDDETATCGDDSGGGSDPGNPDEPGDGFPPDEIPGTGVGDDIAEYILRMQRYYARLQACDTEMDLWITACWNAAQMPKDAANYAACEAWARNNNAICRDSIIF